MIIGLIFCLTWIRCEDDCDQLPSWFQRDKCLCDSNQDHCDVYCKEPFLDMSICEEKARGNDELLCKYYHERDACENYCASDKNKNTDCMCIYVSQDNSCTDSCASGTDERKIECSCKYHSSDSSTSLTEDCFIYCEGFEGKEKDDCRCEYLSDSKACEDSCNGIDDEFSRNECLCLLGMELEQKATSACETVSKIIEDDAKKYQVTNDTEASKAADEAFLLSKCYYEKHEASCIEYCMTFNNSESLKTDSCLCSKIKDQASCFRECDKGYSDDGENFECKCSVDTSFCEKFCYKEFGNGTKNNETDKDNKDLQECLCQYMRTYNETDGSTNYDPSCGNLCRLVFHGNDESEKIKKNVLCHNYCSAQTTLDNPDGQRTCKCDILEEPDGCDVYCKNISSLQSDLKMQEMYVGKCRSYCDSLGWAEDVSYCLCKYSIDPFLCLDYCQDTSFDRSLCETYCSSLTTTESLLCECNYLNNSACQNFCETYETDSLRLDCFCDYGLNEACYKRCEALGREGLVVEKARCLCRSKINLTACTDYCDMSLAGHENSAQLQDKCKCDYKQGDEYCTRYSNTLPDKEHLHYECTMRGDKQACYDYCLYHVSIHGNNTETYKCWCEVYGDVTWCPVYCDILDTFHPDSLRCKCLYFNDDPSCEQYCATIKVGTPERSKCQCTIMRETEGAEKDMSPEGHHKGCENYCRSLPTYGERIECSCKYKLDEARCKEMSDLSIGAASEPLQSDLYWSLCQIWDGLDHEKNCRFHCDWLYHEAIERNQSESSAYEKLLYCYCEVVRARPFCVRYCDVKYPESEWDDSEIDGKDYNQSKGNHAKCLCEHGAFLDQCGVVCSLLFPWEVGHTPSTIEEYKQQALNAECMCNTTQYFAEGYADHSAFLPFCKLACTRKYGEGDGGAGGGDDGGSKHLPYYSCYVNYNKRSSNETFCKQFREEAMQRFCLCFYNPGTAVCNSYCDALDNAEQEEEEEEEEEEGENQPKPVPMKSMCECFWGNDEACGVFCKNGTFSASLCRRSCSIFLNSNETEKYMECLCTAQVAHGCKAVCDQYFKNETMDEYYKCRCDKKLDLLSCVHYCGNFPNNTDSESDGDSTGNNAEGEPQTRDKCLADLVYKGPGKPAGKRRYVDDYDTDDQYLFSDIPVVAEKEEEEEEEEGDDEEPIVEELKAEGWWENKTNRLIVIIAGSVFIVALAITVVVIIVVYRYKKNSGNLGEEGQDMLEIKEAERSYIDDYDKEEEKKAGGGVAIDPRDTPSPAPMPSISGQDDLLPSVHSSPSDSD